MTPEALARFDKLGDDAIRHTVEACEREMPELFRRFGDRATQFCTDDTRFHLDFLRASLEIEDPAPFHEYLGWLVEVLASRQVPTASLPHALKVLAQFFRVRMSGDDGETIAHMLEGSVRALADGIPPPTYAKSTGEMLPEFDAFRDAVLAGDRRGASALFHQALDREKSLVQVSVNLLQPVLYEVGHLWQQNKVSVAQEHLIAALIHTLLSQGYALADPVADAGRKALFACVEGNHHNLGLRMVADAFELAGWDVHFLGANTPVGEVVRYAEYSKPDLIGLSVALPSQLKTFRATVAGLRSAFAADVPRIVAGGAVINRFPALAAHAGAEVLGADAVTAVNQFA